MGIWQRLKEKKKKFDEMSIQGLIELQDDIQNQDSKLHCQHCQNPLGFFKMLVIAKSYDIGQKYPVKCRRCKKINYITKGESKDESRDNKSDT